MTRNIRNPYLVAILACLSLLLCAGLATAQDGGLSAEDLAPISQADLDFYKDYAVFRHQAEGGPSQEDLDAFFSERGYTPLRCHVIDQRVASVLFGSLVAQPEIQPSQDDVDLINQDKDRLESAVISGTY
ncbi:MAG: hypothetical protein LBL95_04855 [Deltaproteobacteria bacterium]|jgi:hypothetical protein|nr:hypothetical protein [Deltaproteobacteria bacterium]